MKFRILFPLLLFVACTTYDKPVIYHKNFSPGTNSLLRFDGYYASADTSIQQGNGVHNANSPFFFYTNGSGFFYHGLVPNGLIHQFENFGSWGNYKVTGDSIVFERFDKQGSNYARIILKGVILKDAIHWTARQEKRFDWSATDYTVNFYPSSVKPDSTRNWTRTLPKWNQ